MSASFHFLQTPHRAIKELSPDFLRSLGPEKGMAALKRREDTIAMMNDEPLYKGVRPKRWLEILLGIARLRLNNLGVPLEVLISGGVRAGKSFFGSWCHNAHFFGTHNAKTWVFHSTKVSSDDIIEPIIYTYLPSELRKAKLTRSKEGNRKMGYTEGHGFTGDKFTLHRRNEIGEDCGGTCSFWTYNNEVRDLQGSALTFIEADELCPESFTETFRERLITRAQDTHAWKAIYEQAIIDLEAGRWPEMHVIAKILHALALYTFTPKDGWTDMVDGFVTGSVIVDSTEAELLPTTLPDGSPGFKRVPLELQCAKKNRRAFYLQTRHNVMGGNWEGLKAELAGADEYRIKISAYGVAEASSQSAWPVFNESVHLIPWSKVPKDLTFFMANDPAGRKPWFLSWLGIDKTGKRYLLRQWPQNGREIHGKGDPGPWAVHAKGAGINGKAGPAQTPLGFGRARYKAEILRVEQELGRWYHGGTGRQDNATFHFKGEAVESWSHDNVTHPIKIHKRLIDRNYAKSEQAGADEATVTLQQELSDEGLHHDVATRDFLEAGFDKITTALAYDPLRPVEVGTNEPELYIVGEYKTGPDGKRWFDGPEAFLFSLKHFTLLTSEGTPLGPAAIQHAPGKEPLDHLRWYLTDEECQHWSEEMFQVLGGLGT